ncbi:MAG: TRAP transporter substrate-binding protein DctP [Spirochaetaceae bacterium]|jgi:TRAP-type C4-dicarboxylate transport system substrate-binding protein|nr:TRAP transporter substrate-binding protein DctP [Spirochaetaceae bacterium]
MKNPLSVPAACFTGVFLDVPCVGRRRLLALLAAFCLLWPGSLAAQRTVTIKLMSQVPENTPWGSLLNRMARDWSAATNGEVNLVIYHNSKSGEADILRQLNMNQIQAAMLSTMGMKLISPEIMTLSCPFLIRNNAELDLVLRNLKQELEQKINSRGYYLLAWSKVGWIRFFSKNPVFVPADLKRQRLGTSDAETELLDAFRAMGYQMVPIAMNQILVSLSGGQIDAVYQSPVNAGGLQIFGLAKNMASIPVAPFLGSIILNQRAWRSIPEKYRNDLIRITRRMEAELDRSVQDFEAEVIQSMVRYGLVINQVSPEQERIWYADANRTLPALIGTIFDRNLYNRISAMLKPYHE